MSSKYYVTKLQPQFFLHVAKYLLNESRFMFIKN